MGNESLRHGRALLLARIRRAAPDLEPEDHEDITQRVLVYLWQTNQLHELHNHRLMKVAADNAIKTWRRSQYRRRPIRGTGWCADPDDPSGTRLRWFDGTWTALVRDIDGTEQRVPIGRARVASGHVPRLPLGHLDLGDGVAPGDADRVPTGLDEAADLVDRVVADELLDQAFAQLDETDRLTYHLLYELDLDTSAAADQLGVARYTMWRRDGRLRNHVRSFIEDGRTAA